MSKLQHIDDTHINRYLMIGYADANQALFLSIDYSERANRAEVLMDRDDVMAVHALLSRALGLPSHVQLTAQVERLETENEWLRVMLSDLQCTCGDPAQTAYGYHANDCTYGKRMADLMKLLKAPEPAATHIPFRSPADQSAWDECQGEQSEGGGERE